MTESDNDEFTALRQGVRRRTEAMRHWISMDYFLDIVGNIVGKGRRDFANT